MSRVVSVSSCKGCPFAHRENESPSTFFCAIAPSVPTISREVLGRTRPASCPLLATDFRITAIP